MAFSKDQREPTMPTGTSAKRSAVDFLPRYFRTNTNQKFLGATVDQLISVGDVDKINAYIGRRNTASRMSTDTFLEDVSVEREAYQLEPSLIIQDSLDNVTFFKDYNDYINQINFFNGNAKDHNVINAQEYYAWNPHISWDKFVNYREYYWLPTGPQAIAVSGQSDVVTSTYTISLVNDGDNMAYVFTPDGVTRNPYFRLYRGQTYIFEIDCPGHPIAFKSERDTSDSYILSEGITKDTIWVEKGTITYTIPQDAPNVIYYVSRNDINTSGFFNVYDFTEASEIDVDTEIIGKKTYTTSGNIELTNGMKVYFQGRVTPAKYASGNWYVEGVGNKIYLVAEKDLEVPSAFTNDIDVRFDDENFDSQGFDVNNNYPATKDYITINRASKDRNAWSRYNRWFHKTVIEQSAIANNQPVEIDQTARATRPIIEFDAGLQLYNHGRAAKLNVDLVDVYTQDVFSTIEGSLGYNIDGVDLVDGMRVLFTADTDIRVSGRIFKVSHVTHLGVSRITLKEETDTDPIEGETVLVLNGLVNRGKMFHYTNGYWKPAQQKTAINQPPMFDVFDASGVSYSDNADYVGTSFKGTKLFSYREGSNYDNELGFNISYKNIGNIGDILFDFNLHSDSFTYQDLSNVVQKSIDTGYLKINDGLASVETTNGWVKAATNSKQPVVRVYDTATTKNFFKIDVYDNSGLITDLIVSSFVNGVKQTIRDFDIYRQNENAYIRFFQDLVVGDVLIVETESSTPKNSNGYYKFPLNLEHNPQNLNLTDFTLGEIINHAQSITNNLSNFYGTTPGASNLRDLGNVSKYGTKVVQHSSPLVPIIYHLTDKRFNVIKSLRYAKDEYSKFKRNLIRVATDYGYDGNIATHLDLILKEVTKEKTESSPYYLSDMIPFGAKFVFDQEIIDNAITEYPLTFDFDLTTSNEKAVIVYLNNIQLLHGRDYEFVNSSFVKIIVPITSGDRLQLVQYSATDGCCVPPTPTKLGLYPAFQPRIFIDDTYQTPTKVIQGHDGSITVAFDDYRDDLLLEFENRIYNNIKVSYDTNMFNIHEFVSGYSRSTDLLRTDLDSVLRQEFLRWSRLISDDYTKNTFYESTNPFTFNYNEFVDPNNNKLPGFWRGMFKYFYDTDRPHTNPWEMLGFTVEPSWWQEVYGAAPYTSDNLILWQDLSEGIIREPGKVVVRNPLYARPSLLSQIPANEFGQLSTPIQANLIRDYVSTNTTGKFIFGDQAPIESAWRRSSEFPFALITALTLLRPARVFATCFDRIRQVRDSAGQIVYSTENGNLRFNTSNLVFSNTTASESRTFTAGLINYVINYAISSSMSAVDEYKSDIRGLKVKISSKLGGFVSKDKFRLILDSRTPLNQSNVFVPEENYNIILNTSSPVLSISYSGVIVEKQTGGFVVKGYNQLVPEFKYFKPLVTASDPVINVGGISESYIDWDSGKFYNKGSIVRYDQSYYRTVTSHTSSSVFEVKYFAKLSALPVTGGREIILRRRFETTASVLHYGAELTTVQDVVDFLLGYGEYLQSAGFSFEFYNDNLKTVVNWQTSVREFVFWTTQNWAAGSVISLSPSADELIFQKDYAVVDNIYDNFYDYTIFKENGKVLDPNFTNSFREENNYTLLPKNTADGIYHATLNLVQKEHVLILDDVTVFNDVIYDQRQGYRQERIKVLGYRTANWNGDFNIPGFVYDRATVVEWSPWRDYALGETVKYKEFYYSAKNNIPGTETFNFDDWFKLAKKPEARLLPNWDYRATEFLDFYDLDSDSFDVDQQQFAQHLIGYQKRDYLENIINDDVAQYKFYQGMIQEKGTQNSLSKLFDALNTADKDSLEFYEEWAIRLGQYGASAAFEEVEYLLDETKFLINPQPVELVRTIDSDLNDFVYRILPDQVYLKPEDYTHSPFPVDSKYSEYIATAGYVHAEDVKAQLTTIDELSTLDINTLKNGDYFWVGFEKTSWNVYRFGLFATKISSLEILGLTLRINVVGAVDPTITVDSYIGIDNTVDALVGIYKVTAVDTNYIEIDKPEQLTDTVVNEINNNPILNLYKFSSQRIANIDGLNDLNLATKKDAELVWVDNTPGNWEVWKYNNTYTSVTTAFSGANFAKDVTVNDTNDVMVTQIDSTVLYYTRPDTNFEWALIDRLTSENVTGYTSTNNTFGQKVTLTPSGESLFVSATGYSSSKGYVARFVKNDNGYFLYDKKYPLAANEGTLVAGEEFGFESVTYGNVLIVASRGNGNASAAITSFNISTGALVSRITFAATQVKDMDISETGTLIVGTSNNQARIYTVSTSGTLTALQTLTSPVSNSSFGESVAISRNGNTVAVGAPYYTGVEAMQGAVYLYSLNSTYGLTTTLLSPANKEAERFGSRIRFNIAGDQLVVYSLGGDQTIPTTFDDGTSSFDLNATNFIEVEGADGSIKVFEKYNTEFVFGAELEVQGTTSNLGSLGYNYGSRFVVTDRVYINDPVETQGAIYEFSNTSKIWSVFRQSDLRVNLDNIKSVFVYDTDKNSIVETLDFVDPIRGKILGIAEQELSYKTYYDPATYMVGTESVVVDELMGWTDKQVGKLWWDLSTVKFINPYQGSAVYKANSWNSVFPGSTVDVYEWVETEYLPSEWDALADTEEGLTAGISGTSKYGDDSYSYKQKFDGVSKTFKNIYYFWVKNKTVIPEVDFRKMSARDVADYIEDPKAKGASFVALLGKNQFSLVNCKDIIYNKKVAINFRYWVIDNKEINVHSHYQLLAVGETTEKLNSYIEKKWFDSLIGYDEQGNDVPDFRLPAKLKYGILSKPRQSMFVNRLEALKQFIERVNSILITRSIIDEYDIVELLSKDAEPTASSGTFDEAVDSYSLVRFVSTANFINAQLTPVVEDGKIKSVVIVNAGQGYGKLVPKTYNAEGQPTSWAGPAVTIVGAGSGAQIKTIVNSAGVITSAEVVKEGAGYTAATTLLVRPLTVLVKADETANGKWTTLVYTPSTQVWSRSKTQTYDTTRYWSYADWYAVGYNQFSRISHQVDYAYQLSGADISIGELVKVNHEGTGGWVLLEKIDDQDIIETTVNYKIVGRQNGTIQFNSNLYKFVDNNSGYDGPSFDYDLYDDQPKEELRIILNTIKNVLFVGELEIEYNNLFFASLRYVFAEQPFVDWAFKTSFVKAKHNLGALEQTPTYQLDILPSYESYISEVKPYRTKVREFISNFTGLENSNSYVTDFDLPTYYDAETKSIKTIRTQVGQFGIEYDSSKVLQAPYSNWYDNVGYSVTEIVVVDGGSGYEIAPQVEIVGLAGEQATATAYLSNGKVKTIVVDYQGSGYFTTPTINLIGSVGEAGTPARAIAILGNSLIRSTKVGIKFDRISPAYQITDLTVTQTFTGSGSRAAFALTWPMDIKSNTVGIYVNDEEKLRSEYTIYNKLDTSVTYPRYYGVVEFIDPTVTVPANSNIVINYTKDITLLDAADRIQHYYNPEPGQIGKDLGQLMTGVDYGGVEVTGIQFSLGAGWDALPWFTSGWDGSDPNYTDQIVISNGVSRNITLNYIPAVGEVINVYLNNSRIDNPTTGIPMSPFIGNGTDQIVTIPNTVALSNGDVLVFRKTTSDGSFIPTESIYDTEIIGGDLTYTTASGINAADINIDGDGFVTPTTSHAPEEVVPGQVVDTVDIKVFNKVTDGTFVIVSRHYGVTDVNELTYDIGQYPAFSAAVFVTVNGLVVHEGSDYTVDYQNRSIVLTHPLTLGDEINITSPSNSGYAVLDMDMVIADGQATEFITKARWNGDYSVIASVDGVPVGVISFVTDSSYSSVNNVAFRFAEAPVANAVVSYIVVSGIVETVNLINKETIIHDGVSHFYQVSALASSYQPAEPPAIVVVNGKVLRPSSFYYFDVSGTNRTYTISNINFAYNSIDSTQISVYLNGEELEVGRDYSWVSANNEVKVKRGVAKTGDRLIVEVYVDAEYTMHQVSGNQFELQLIDSYPAGTEVVVTFLLDNNIIRIERQNNILTSQTDLTPGSIDYYNFTQLTGGRFKLPRPAIGAEYAWISINGKPITPNVDYILEEDRLHIQINPERHLQPTDNLDVIVFSSNVTKTSFGYKVFKDMLNRTTFVRIDDTISTKLAQPLNYYDTSIVVEDASMLPGASKINNTPGVVMIESELIEYFEKNGNVLSQLRRGILGTGTKTIYAAGTRVRDHSYGQTVPYRDEILDSTTTDPINDRQTIALDFIPNVKTGTTDSSWYRSSIPAGYGQCDEIEVFVAGRRLRKSPITIWNADIGPDSPVGDQQHEAEYSVDGISASVRLTTPAPAGVTVVVQKRIGKIWAPIGTSLVDATTDIANFIRAKAATLPQ